MVDKHYQLGNKTANVNVKTCQFKTWCKGDEANRKQHRS